MDKSNWSLIFERPNHREREGRGKERRRGRGREEEGKKRCSQDKKGMDSMIFGMELVYIFMDTYLWVVGCEKPNPKMNACMEIFTIPLISLGFC